MSRPQDKNLIPLNQRTEEEARAIQSKGGKASAQARKQRQMMSELLEHYSELPVKDKRVIKRLKNLGFDVDDITQKLLIADAIMKAAQHGNTYAIQLYLEITGEIGATAGIQKENNMLEAILNSTTGEITADEIPEIQYAANSDSDVVE
ncbi:MAG: hypothetical protein LUD27_00600 [Clostridia bacterium]|nr:hypothetical protein [Clostridia bacterium]